MAVAGPSFVRIDDSSPLIKYGGTWGSNRTLEEDPAIPQYYQQTFHATREEGASATVFFEGTDLILYGSFRLNHNYYSVSLDGSPKAFYNGYGNTPETFQMPLFSARGLDPGVHTVTVWHEPWYQWTQSPDAINWLDLDFIELVGTLIDPSDTAKLDATQRLISTPTQSSDMPSQTMHQQLQASSIAAGGSTSPVFASPSLPPIPLIAASSSAFPRIPRQQPPMRFVLALGVLILCRWW